MDEFLQEYYTAIPDQYFPVSIALHNQPAPGPIFASHYHEHLQFIYCLNGKALIYCSGHSVPLSAGEVMVVNVNEIHYGESLSKDLSYYVIMIDLDFILSNRVDTCQTQYISPLALNQILFANRLDSDHELNGCLQRIIYEYGAQRPGFELAVKACIYNAIVLLLRNHVVKTLSHKKYDKQAANARCFQDVFQYMKENYGQKIDLQELAAVARLSTSQFCRIFKKLTGKSAVDYLNQLRIEKAAVLLRQGESNIKEIAFATGFDDTNYFSRVFKKYKNIPPKEFRNSIQ